MIFGYHYVIGKTQTRKNLQKLTMNAKNGGSGLFLHLLTKAISSIKNSNLYVLLHISVVIRWQCNGRNCKLHPLISTSFFAFVFPEPSLSCCLLLVVGSQLFHADFYKFLAHSLPHPSKEKLNATLSEKINF